MNIYNTTTQKEALKAALEDKEVQWTDEEKRALEGIISDENNLGVRLSPSKSFWSLAGTGIVFATEKYFSGYTVRRVLFAGIKAGRR